MDVDADKVLRIDFHDDNRVYDCWIGLKENQVLFYLYNELRYEDFDFFKSKLNHQNVSALMFIRWAIGNDLMVLNSKNETIICTIKDIEGYKNLLVLDFIKILNRGFIDEKNFVIDKQNAIRKYIYNIDVESYYYDDFCKLFLDNANVFDNEAKIQFDKIVTFSEENYQKVKTMLDGKFLSH